MNLSESNRKKWIGGAAVLAMLLAAASIGRTVYLQRLAASSNTPEAQAAAINARLVLSPEEQAHRLEMVKHLRDTWKPWAEKHQAQLQRMLSASPSDTVARDAVWKEIPTFPRDNKEFVAALNSHGNGAKGEVFSWFAISKDVNVSQMSQKDVEHHQAADQWALEKNFASHHDVVISDSSQIGNVSVSLWASGRVTEDTCQDKIPIYKGFGVFAYDRKEILPPYDFLISK